jgi:hypothetical protein
MVPLWLVILATILMIAFTSVMVSWFVTYKIEKRYWVLAIMLFVWTFSLFTMIVAMGVGIAWPK